jgi:hypothetical protein
MCLVAQALDSGYSSPSSHRFKFILFTEVLELHVWVGGMVPKKKRRYPLIKKN